jgi:hypothetical protein
MRILGIDPGQRTGVAVIEVTDDTAPVLVSYEEVYGGVNGFTIWWETHPPYDVLVAERYIPRGGTPQKNAGAPLGVLGFLDQFNPVLQTPAGRAVSVSDAVLKRLGLYLPGERLRNVREAVRHVVWYLKNQRHRPTLVKGWTP